MEISEVDTDNESAPVFKIALNKSSPAHTNQNLNQRHVSDVNKSSPSHQNSDRKSMAAAKKWGTKSGESTDPSPGANGNKIPPVLVLNVGGVYYTTHRSTIRRYPDSMLAVMFSGRHETQTDNRGAFFIDRTGTYFGYILEFLRSETLPPNDVALAVLKEARYYGLVELEDRMAVLPSISALIVKESHRAQFPDYQEVKKRIIQIAMENATVSKTGEVLIYAFRQEFIPKAPNFNVNHNCSADQAHISVGPWDSIADEETFVRCLESDLIDEEFNIKVHEGKRRCKYFYGQSCQKCVFRIQIVFG